MLPLLRLLQIFIHLPAFIFYFYFRSIFSIIVHAHWDDNSETFYNCNAIVDYNVEKDCECVCVQHTFSIWNSNSRTMKRLLFLWVVETVNCCGHFVQVLAFLIHSCHSSLLLFAAVIMLFVFLFADFFFTSFRWPFHSLPIDLYVPVIDVLTISFLLSFVSVCVFNVIVAVSQFYFFCHLTS